MFTCYRLVDKATTDDDLPPPGITLAEAVQLSRQDPANVKRLISKAVQKLDSQLVMVRLKALRFMLHLAQNGPPACIAEVRLQTASISNCISWRGPPHPTRGFEPYQEMKDAAQSLLDMSFSQQSAPVTNFAVTNAPTNLNQINRVAGVTSFESCGNSEYITQAPSLEPRNLDPNAQNSVGNQIKGFVGKFFNRNQPSAPVQSKFGSASNVSGVVPGTNDYSYPPGAGMYQQSMGGPLGPQQNPTEPPPFIAPVNPLPPKNPLGHIQQDISWAKKKPVDPIPVKAKAATDTPAAKLLKVVGNRALPTNSELTAFKNVVTPESIAELKAGLNNPDWKVKVRAISGLEIYGEKFGIATTADTKDVVAKLKTAPQQSLRTAAIRFHETIENVEPEAPPETPSAFNFGGPEEGAAQAGGEQGFDFANE
ncbi:epsin N-terminal-likey (ENTH) domain containing protein [Tritrichomonas foetus]|uniref:Epsin N-terminal-likey (ENTH) domain containing protein n=1 Tax=Tritrichomonas foetus TaxID=1144522 RepID=A0A1J4JNM4_9EUKA|nr:epsin N-terminal-likey (ENTH) domain containing protein [Tritrichomonas foetus]|eukprot:OHT00683.1 epsin N-terminal-likey (ENTH) domain containing protein [Tritrichomonas foetus]